MRPTGFEYDVPHEALEFLTTRRTLARVFIRGAGIEVGAGTRPWPLPEGVKCFYGDVRDEKALEQYFERAGSHLDGNLDAQTFFGIEDNSVDFVLSAQVIEHLLDPLGAIGNALRIIKPGGIFMFALPDMRYIFDAPRPVTSWTHLLEDFKTGGEPSRREAYFECEMYLARLPDEDIVDRVSLLMRVKADAHFHTWTTESFIHMVNWACEHFGAQLMHTEAVDCENIAVLKKLDKNSKKTPLISTIFRRLMSPN
jgi:SAM-dependent methyltransferase